MNTPHMTIYIANNPTQTILIEDRGMMRENISSLTTTAKTIKTTTTPVTIPLRTTMIADKMRAVQTTRVALPTIVLSITAAPMIAAALLMATHSTVVVPLVEVSIAAVHPVAVLSTVVAPLAEALIAAVHPVAVPSTVVAPLVEAPIAVPVAVFLTAVAADLSNHYTK